MPDIKVITEVAGRVCALPAETGTALNEGDEVAFVEAMKMEIPVPAPAGGTLKTLLVKLDDVVAEAHGFFAAEDLPDVRAFLGEPFEAAEDGWRFGESQVYLTVDNEVGGVAVGHETLSAELENRLAA